jgi:hypothetical protein
LFCNIFRLQCNHLQNRIQRLDRYLKKKINVWKNLGCFDAKNISPKVWKVEIQYCHEFVVRCSSVFSYDFCTIGLTHKHLVFLVSDKFVLPQSSSTIQFHCHISHNHMQMICKIYDIWHNRKFLFQVFFIFFRKTQWQKQLYASAFF